MNLRFTYLYFVCCGDVSEIMLKSVFDKKMLTFSACLGSALILGSKYGASAVIKKTLTSGVSTYSSYVFKRTALKNSSKNLNPLNLSNGDFGNVAHKIGEFQVPGGKSVRLPIYTRKNSEGLTINFTKVEEGDEEILVTKLGNGSYSKTLSVSEMKIFDRINHGVLQPAIDKLGNERVVFILSGDSGSVAVDVGNGVLRDVLPVGGRNNTKYYLGHQIDENSLSIDVKNKVSDLKQEVFSYAAPVVSSIKAKLID